MKLCPKRGSVAPTEGSLNADQRTSYTKPPPNPCANYGKRRFLEGNRAFSHTFDGDFEWGSRTKCAEVANAHRHNTLTELRTCLFFEQRRWNHFGDRPDAEAMTYIHGLIAAISKKVS